MRNLSAGPEASVAPAVSLVHREEVVKMKALRTVGVWTILFVGTLTAVACSKASRGRDLELKSYPLDSLQGVIQGTGVQIDTQIKASGGGSLRIDVTEPSVIRLFETGPLEVDGATLVYRARLRTANAQGNVYLEMWCQFPGEGEFFSRGLQSPLRGTNDWTTQEIVFFLKKGEKPDNVKLNVVSEGPGVIWIDDIRLFQRSS
jgi:hypothetical protein